MVIQKKKMVITGVTIFAMFLILITGTSLALPAKAATFTFSKLNFHNPLKIDNKYFPLKPGTTFMYKGTKDGEPSSDKFQVTNKVKVIQGISARVIHDEAFVKGKLSESTDDWFAQDDSGNVWYFGEFTTEFPTGSHEGSWQAGVKGAKAGIIMEAQPKVGDSYNEELAKGVAEDKATVLSLNEKVCVPFGCFTHVLKTKNFTPLEPDVVENKFYAPGVGVIKEVTVKGGTDEDHLVQITGGDISKQQQGNSVQSSNSDSGASELKQQDHSKTIKGNNQPTHQQQKIDAQKQDHSKSINGDNPPTQQKQQQQQIEPQQQLKTNNPENKSSPK